jgi:hypothetical protein
MSKVLQKYETIKELAKVLSNFSWKPWLLFFFDFMILKKNKLVVFFKYKKSQTPTPMYFQMDSHFES